MMESKILYEGVISFLDYECNPSYTVIVSYDRKLVENTLKDISEGLRLLPKVKRTHSLRLVNVPEVVISYLESLNQFDSPIMTHIVDHEIDKPLITLDEIMEVSSYIDKYGNMNIKELKEKLSDGIL